MATVVDIFEINVQPIADAVENGVRALKDAFGALISGGSISEAVKQGQELLGVMRDLEDTENALYIVTGKQIGRAHV